MSLDNTTLIPRTLDAIFFFVYKLNIPPKGSDKFWVYYLWLIEEMPCTIEKQCLIELQTHFFKFLYVEKVFNMDGGFIVNVYGSDFQGWNDLSDRV